MRSIFPTHTSIMLLRNLICVCLLAFLTTVGFAQAPVGTISGLVTDPSGAVLPNATISVKNKATGAERKVTSSAEGTYSVPALPAGLYEVSTQVKGFSTQQQEVTITIGSIITVESKMQVGQTTEVVNIEGTGSAQLATESHSIDGVITRQKIQELPLNGRNFLQLAFLEPGVSTSAGTTSQYNSLFSVSILGGDPGKTAITVDGGNVRNSIEGGTGMNFSQEMVQEFQLSSANFDLSTGITSVGSVNVVSRSGGNKFHGSTYYYYRDHNMSAYPGLKRVCVENPTTLVCTNPGDRKRVEDPFFARSNPGFVFSGPIKKNRAYFFTNYEYTKQTQAFTVQPNLPSIAGLAGNFSSPYAGHLLSVKVDVKLTDKHNIFGRFSNDKNQGFGPGGGATLPSNWLQNTNTSRQSVIGLTSVLKSTLVNDFRFSFTYWRNRNLFADNTVCAGCLGLGFGQLAINGSNLTLGNTSNATQGRDLYRYNFTDNLTWVKGSHRFRVGTELETAPGTGFWGYCDPACNTAAPPELVRSLPFPAATIAALFPTLPTVVRTNADLLNLPFLGGVIGVGDPAQPPPYNIDKAKVNNRMRFYGQDTWKVTPKFTLNYGLSWNFESTLVNRDIDKPKFLAPLYGSDLTATNNNYKNFSPSIGLAYSPNNKTVFRGGAGIYWDTESLFRRLQERAFIGPLGNGRIQFPASGFTNIFPGIVNISRGGVPLPVGATLPQGELTNLTVGMYNQIVAAQLPAIINSLKPASANDLTIRSIDINKSAAQLYPKNYPVQRSYQMTAGVQRDLGHNMVLNVDLVRRVFTNLLLGEIDYNRFNRRIAGVQSPVIRICAPAERSNPAIQCSNGSITFWTPGGRSTYNAMLLKLDKRFSDHFLFTVSYALTNNHGYNGINNLDKYNSTWGPQGGRHSLNVSGIVELPWGFQLGVISSMGSKGPLTPTVSGVDLDGDGTASEPLPGLSWNCINRGCGKTELAAAVARWNTTYLGKTDARGQAIPQLTLPANYTLGDNFKSQDIRISKKFTFKENYKLSVFSEMFNVFNFANLGGYNFTVNSGGAFGQATSRGNQVFGSGGPRAIQFGARFEF